MKGQVAVWLFAEWARAILGAPKRKGKPSRWVALGKREHDEPLLDGIWLDSGLIEEWRPNGKKVPWTFTPRKLLLRRDAVITVQDMEGEGKLIGFKAEPPRKI